jgi:hypothetical protein
LDVAYVFTMVSSVFSVVFASFTDACFKCFICLQTKVASVVSECFKSISGVTYPSSPSVGLVSVSHPPSCVG